MEPPDTYSKYIYSLSPTCYTNDYQLTSSRVQWYLNLQSEINDADKWLYGRPIKSTMLSLLKTCELTSTEYI